MAKKKRSSKSASASDETEFNRKVTGDRALKELREAFERAKDKTSTISGSLGNMVREFVENRHLNPRAFRMAMSFLGKDPVKARADYDDLMHYLDVYGFDKHKAADLFKDQSDLDRARGKKVEKKPEDNVESLEEARAAREEQTGEAMQAAE